MCKNIVIFSTKGGVGKSLIASNIAVSLGAKENKKRACLIDLDLHGTGDMARMLNIAPQRAIADFINLIKTSPRAPDAKDFVFHTSYNVDFLPGIIKPRQSSLVEADYIARIFAILEKEYDYIVVDAGRNFSDVFLEVLNRANLIILAATPDILSIYQTKWALDTLQFLQFPLAMIKIILNRAESLSSIALHDIKATLPVDIIAQIPSDGRTVNFAVNRGVPVVIDNPKTKISAAINKLCKDLLANEKLFIEHRDIGQMKNKDMLLEKAGTFWQVQGLAEGLGENADYQSDMDEVILLKRRIHSRLIEELNIKSIDLKVFSDPKKSKELRDRAEILITNLLAEDTKSFISSHEVRKKLVKEILDEALGLGPLEDLLADNEITDVMVNNKDEIYVERSGKIELTSKKFISNEQVKTTIERIIAPIGRRIDESVPMVDARLPDGSRVNAIIPPLALTGPTLTIRKFRKEIFGTDELVKLETIDKTMAEFLKACVVSRKNVIVSGGTGSGKTTILNILSGFIPNNERIITIEDAAELKLQQEHWVRLESKPPNIEGKGAVGVRDLFRNTLRMRPDRIIIGECRGIETLDMLQAMNTGHDGSMTTVHANSTQDVLSRLDSMILMGGIELPIRAIREMISSAVDIIVHTARLSDGTRKLTQITEITGMLDEMHIGLNNIFIFKQTGVDAKGKVLGGFEPTGFIPTFIEDIRIRGIKLPDSIFKKQ